MGRRRRSWTLQVFLVVLLVLVGILVRLGLGLRFALVDLYRLGIIIECFIALRVTKTNDLIHDAFFQSARHSSGMSIIHSNTRKPQNVNRTVVGTWNNSSNHLQSRSCPVTSEVDSGLAVTEAAVGICCRGR